MSRTKFDCRRGRLGRPSKLGILISFSTFRWPVDGLKQCRGPALPAFRTAAAPSCGRHRHADGLEHLAGFDPQFPGRGAQRAIQRSWVNPEWPNVQRALQHAQRPARVSLFGISSEVRKGQLRGEEEVGTVSTSRSSRIRSRMSGVMRAWWARPPRSRTAHYAVIAVVARAACTNGLGIQPHGLWIERVGSVNSRPRCCVIPPAKRGRRSWRGICSGHLGRPASRHRKSRRRRQKAGIAIRVTLTPGRGAAWKALSIGRHQQCSGANVGGSLRPLENQQVLEVW